MLMVKNSFSKIRIQKNKLNPGVFFVIAVIFGGIGFFVLNVSSAAVRSVDLKKYYPNTAQYETKYLEGFNYITGAPQRSVLWFEKQDQWTFKTYNSGPEDINSRCHYDELSWWDDNTLRYSKTHHECPGSASNEIVYDAPIIFLPRYWDKANGKWTYSGSSSAKYYENGGLRCTGTNAYVAEIIGEEEIAPGQKGIHWRTTQTTSWQTGDVAGKCFAGYTTRWQEDYWLSKLPMPNGKLAEGLKRSKGGNLDNSNSSWDVWFDNWKYLP
jgi:hypothetical protein